MAGKCGNCTACCRVYAIPEVQKGEHEWCQHCAIGKGCRIYETRPPPCVDYQCFWLATGNMPVELRPDHLKVVFTLSTNPRVVDAVTLPNYDNAWQKPYARAMIGMFHRANMAVSIGPPGSNVRLLLRPDGTITKVQLSEPDENGIRWGEDK